MSDVTPAEAPAAPAENTTPTTPAPATEAPAAPAESNTQPEPTAPQNGANQTYFTNEQLAEMQKFMENNGGFDKVWKQTKQSISSPQQPAQPVQPEPVKADPVPQQPAQPAQPEPRAGSYSLEEVATMQYFDRLATEDKYKSIADEIRNGEVMKGLKEFNIRPVSDGRINDADIRKYLDLYAATKPATPTSTEPTASSRPDYVKIDKITTRQQADQIQLQNIQLRAAGLPEHPLTQEAKDFVSNYYKGNKQ